MVPQRARVARKEQAQPVVGAQMPEVYGTSASIASHPSSYQSIDGSVRPFEQHALDVHGSRFS